MKELSIEEKAKRYDEIIEKANKMHCENCEACQMCIEELIPELAESEDERIRKSLIDFFNKGAENGEQTNGVYDKDILAWLEKQDKQKSVDVRTTGYWHVEDVEQKPAWSEEDEGMRINLIQGFEMMKDGASSDTVKALYDKKIDWLESLRPQNTWKPSEEQILAIETAINVIGKGTLSGKQLVELQEQLKKLKG